MGYAPQPTLPARPLIEYARRSGKRTRLGDASPLQRMYFRTKQSGRITVFSADKLAVNWFGVHPSEIWPTWFDATVEVDQ